MMDHLSFVKLWMLASINYRPVGKAVRCSYFSVCSLIIGSHRPPPLLEGGQCGCRVACGTQVEGTCITSSVASHILLDLISLCLSGREGLCECSNTVKSPSSLCGDLEKWDLQETSLDEVPGLVVLVPAV